MIILGIETSCDETAISMVEAGGDLQNLSFKVLGSALHSQIKLHKEYGGVFPALAKREHIKNLPIVYKQALENANISENKIEMIAVTVGPGLEPALWTGIKFAEELGKRCGKLVIPTNHMVGHIASVLFHKTDENSKSEAPNPKLSFPALALLISGGHTELVLLNSWVDKKKIGETQDDAVGEAFDKVARMIGLPYPGGPGISRLAEEAREKKVHLETRFPRPMLHSGDLNFSFSGLKTAVLYYLRKEEKSVMERTSGAKQGQESGMTDFSELQMEVAREFEDAVIDTLLSKTKAAIEKYLPKTLIIGGGVIANKALRENFLQLKTSYPDLEILIPEKELTTDNAVMIAAAGYIKYLEGTTKMPQSLEAEGHLDIQ